MNNCMQVHVFTVCGKEAIKMMRRENKEVRRKRLLLRLIRERREHREIGKAK